MLPAFTDRKGVRRAVICLAASTPSQDAHDVGGLAQNTALTWKINLPPGTLFIEVGTTLDIYSHVTPGLQEAAALRFDEGLAGTNKPEPRKEAA